MKTIEIGNMYAVRYIRNGVESHAIGTVIAVTDDAVFIEYNSNPSNCQVIKNADILLFAEIGYL